MTRISHERLKELVRYDPETGEFWLLQTKSRQLVNKLPYLLGQKPSTYRQSMLEGRVYRHNILAYFYMTGEWPPAGMEVDHEDRDILNDRWSNLRLLSKTENIRNQSETKDHTKSGYTGIAIKNSGLKRFKAYIRVDTKLKHLGSFLTLEEALTARRSAEKIYFISTHGETANDTNNHIT